MLASLTAALVAALCYGIASVMQAVAVREASNRSQAQASAGGVDPGLVPRMLSQWRFVVSVVIDLLGFLAQLVALRRLPLFAVQAMVAANLAVVAVLATIIIGTRLALREWLAVLGVVSMLIGLAISTLVTKGDQTMPILVGVTMVQVALSGGLFPLSGKALSVLSSIAPARWGLGALGSTINLNALQASEYTGGPNGEKPDALWTHDPAHWLTSMGVMIFIGIIWLVIARVRLASIGPRKRKEKKATAPHPVGQRVGV